MRGKRTDGEVKIEVPDTRDYIISIRARYPSLPETASDLVTRLGNLYRMLDYHSERLNRDPGDEYATEHYQKLATLALRHEDALRELAPKSGAGLTPIKP